MVIGYLVQLIALTCFWFLPESPRLLAELNRLQECQESLTAIAKWNRAELEFDPNDPDLFKTGRSKCALILTGFPEGTTHNQVTVHLAQNVISTPKAVTSTPEGYFEVDFKSE